MRYVRTRLTLLLLSFAVALLGACGMQNVKEGQQQQAAPELMPTLKFIPELETGKEGETLPYELLANPYIKRGRINKGSVNLYISARKYFRKKQYSQAEKILLELVANDSSLSGPWVMRGDIAIQRKDTTEAKKHYVKALEINTNNMNAWLRLAHAQRLEGEYIPAQNSYAKALAIWKDCPEAHLNLAVLYDIYLNLPLRAQKHMEAYLFLKGKKDEKVTTWLEEIMQRTGVARSLPLDNPVLKPLS